MKKLFLILTFIIIILLSSIYSILFTKPGNDTLASYIQEQINTKQNKTIAKVEKLLITPNSIDFLLSFDNNSSVSLNGDFSLLEQNIQLKYDINIDDLSKLEKVINQKLNGSFQTNGEIEGLVSDFIINGTSNIAKSNTTYFTNIKDYSATNVKFEIKNAKIDELLYMINQKKYAKGTLNIHGKIDNVKNLKGEINTFVHNGLINNNHVNKDFNLKLKEPITFKAEATTNLQEKQAITNLELLTSLAKINSKNILFNLEDLSLKSDYKINIQNLSKLEDLAQRKLRGKFILDGKIEKTSSLLKIDGKSSSFDGKIDFLLKNNELNASIVDIKIKKLLHTLYLPEIIDSSSKLSIDYDIKNKKGIITGHLINGRLQKNRFSSLVNNLAKFDLTKEVYEKIDIKTKIDNQKLNSTVKMTSKFTQINIDKSHLDLEKNYTNTHIKLKIKKFDLPIKVKGKLNEPNFSFDEKIFLKNQLKKNEDKIINGIKSLF